MPGGMLVYQTENADKNARNSNRRHAGVSTEHAEKNAHISNWRHAHAGKK
jgi:hypothetical protein